jgi:hypothetical protein
MHLPCPSQNFAPSAQKHCLLAESHCSLKPHKGLSAQTPDWQTLPDGHWLLSQHDLSAMHLSPHMHTPASQYALSPQFMLAHESKGWGTVLFNGCALIVDCEQPAITISRTHNAEINHRPIMKLVQ